MIVVRNWHCIGDGECDPCHALLQQMRLYIERCSYSCVSQVLVDQMSPSRVTPCTMWFVVSAAGYPFQVGLPLLPWRPLEPGPAQP